MSILTKTKNHLFRWSPFWSWRVCKQAKFSRLGHRKPARIYWKADAPKTSHCLMRILVQRHNWAIFLGKWARRGSYSQCWSLLGHFELIFVHKIWRGGYWQHLVSTERSYVPHTVGLLFVGCRQWKHWFINDTRYSIFQLRFTPMCHNSVKIVFQ